MNFSPEDHFKWPEMIKTDYFHANICHKIKPIKQSCHAYWQNKYRISPRKLNPMKNPFNSMKFWWIYLRLKTVDTKSNLNFNSSSYIFTFTDSSDLNLVFNLKYSSQNFIKWTGVVILHIENKSAPLRGQKIINPPQNRAVNFQKFPYF